MDFETAYESQVHTDFLEVLLLLFPVPVRCHSSLAVEQKNISHSRFALEKNARSDGPPVTLEISFNSQPTECTFFIRNSAADCSWLTEFIALKCFQEKNNCEIKYNNGSQQYLKIHLALVGTLC